MRLKDICNYVASVFYKPTSPALNTYTVAAGSHTFGESTDPHHNKLKAVRESIQAALQSKDIPVIFIVDGSNFGVLGHPHRKNPYLSLNTTEDGAKKIAALAGVTKVHFEHVAPIAAALPASASLPAPQTP